MEEKYELTETIRGKIIKYQKWKVKNKKKFLNNINNKQIIRQALVYDVLEDKKITLSDEEYKYMLLKIRNESIKKPMEMVIECTECESEFDYEIILDDIINVLGEEKYSEIEVNEHIFKMGDIKNRDFYEEIIFSTNDNDERLLIDFILHIDSYNDQDYEFEEINELINNIDVEDFEKIFLKWENMRFKIDNSCDVECPNCKYKESFIFKDLPGFFPENWVV